jgi:DNA polymerase-1
MALPAGKYVAFDFETSGTLPEFALQPWRIPQGKAWATSLAWVWKPEGKFVAGGGLDPSVAAMRALLEDCIANKRTLVGWNLVFDIAILLAYGLEDLVMQCKYLDGLHLWRHLDIEPEYELDRSKKRHYGLKDYVKKHLKWMAGYEEEIDFHDPSPEARRKLHKYNVQDNIAAYLGVEALFEALSPEQRRAALIEAECLPLVAKANLQGMVIDTLATQDLGGILADTAKNQLAKLAEHGVTEKIVRSPVQLSKLIFDDWGLPVYKENVSDKTGKVSRSTDKEVLHELSFEDPRAREIKLYREALGNKTKFADTLLISAEYNEDGCAHPQAIVFGTYSGRLTYASKQGKNKAARPIGFALHQEKNDRLFRSAITVPDGYVLVEFDAAGQEFRWMAIQSGDEVMLSLCAPGEDAHSYMGSRVCARDYRELVRLVHEEDKQASADRKLGKVANLSLQYRTSAKRLRSVSRVQYNIPMELPQAQRIHATYQRAYPGVPRYWQKQIQLVKRRGYAETLAGRRVQVVGDWTGKMAWPMESTAINYPIQGTGAEQKYLAIMVMKPYLREIGAYFAWDLHDGLYFYVPRNKVQEFIEKGKRMLDNLPYKQAWGFTPPIPMPFDVKVGGSWGALKEVKV